MGSNSVRVDLARRRDESRAPSTRHLAKRRDRSLPARTLKYSKPRPCRTLRLALSGIMGSGLFERLAVVGEREILKTIFFLSVTPAGIGWG